MQEIKFKAWDKVAKKMYEVRALYFPQCRDNQVRIVDIGRKSEFTVSIDDVDLMQYTGLTDNTKWEQLTNKEQTVWLKEHTHEEWNGKEIYEGDIITGQPISNIDDIPHIGTVAHFECIYIVKGTKGKSALLQQMWRYNNIEVIGNTHENPELLEASHG